MPGYKEWDPRITDEAPGRAMSAEGPMVLDGRHGGRDQLEHAPSSAYIATLNLFPP